MATIAELEAAKGALAEKGALLEQAMQAKRGADWIKPDVEYGPACTVKVTCTLGSAMSGYDAAMALLADELHALIPTAIENAKAKAASLAEAALA